MRVTHADGAGQAACPIPALHAAILEALSTALDHLTAPRHLGLLLYLSLLLQVILLGAHAVFFIECRCIAQPLLWLAVSANGHTCSTDHCEQGR